MQTEKEKNLQWLKNEIQRDEKEILKDKDKLIFPKSDKSIEITFYSKDEFIINSNNKNLITKNKKTITIGIATVNKRAI